MEFRPRSISPIQARGVYPRIVAAIERDENLHADARALCLERMAPGDHLARRGFPDGVHLESPYLDKGASKSMLG